MLGEPGGCLIAADREDSACRKPSASGAHAARATMIAMMITWTGCRQAAKAMN